MNKIKFRNPVTIVADGLFPSSEVALRILKQSGSIIACDGAADILDKKKYRIDAIIGDMDSISDKVKKKYSDIIHLEGDQSENDLRKALNFLISTGIKDVSILGATGKREDHSLGNIFSLTSYSSKVNMKIFTDTGCFLCLDKDSNFQSFKGQKISLFAFDNSIKLTTIGLKYNFNYNCISPIYLGTLNESSGDCFEIKISHGKVLVFLCY